MITNILNFETPFCSPQRIKSSSNRFSIKGSFSNFAAMEKVFTLSSGMRQQPGPSLSYRERRVQDWARSSIETVSLTPEKNPLAKEYTWYSKGPKDAFKSNNQFYSTRECSIRNWALKQQRSTNNETFPNNKSVYR